MIMADERQLRTIACSSSVETIACFLDELEQAEELSEFKYIDCYVHNLLTMFFRKQNERIGKAVL